MIERKQEKELCSLGRPIYNSVIDELDLHLAVSGTLTCHPQISKLLIKGYPLQRSLFLYGADKWRTTCKPFV